MSTSEQPDRKWSWKLSAFLLFLVAAVTGVLFLLKRYPLNLPVDYKDPLEQFKYGSVGTDIENGMPLKLLRILPQVFPEYLPEGSEYQDYTAFGFIQEPGHAMPIGFSTRHRIIELTGLNCAICHTGEVVTPQEPAGKVILGMPANTVDLQSFFSFLFKCAEDWRFTVDYLIPQMEKVYTMGIIEKALHRLAIPLFQGELLARQAKLTFYFAGTERPRWGPGRVDTFNTFKFDHFAEFYHDQTIPEEELYGAVALPPIWNQQPREGLWLHWDGNNSSVRERNFSAALAAGATRENVDIPRLYAVENLLLNLQPPTIPFPVDETQVTRGKAIYKQYCFDCHDFAGTRVGTVVPLPEIGTDRHRLDSYTEKFRQIQAQYTAGYEWQFKHFRKTDGYVNVPLDGLWARSPYLHNGSVPTMWDLLKPEDQRPTKFYLGDIVFDARKLGFRHNVPQVGGRSLFLLDTQLKGNGNQGHSGSPYGTALSDEDKWALIEYLKTL